MSSFAGVPWSTFAESESTFAESGSTFADVSGSGFDSLDSVTPPLGIVPLSKLAVESTCFVNSCLGSGTFSSDSSTTGVSFPDKSPLESSI